MPVKWLSRTEATDLVRHCLTVGRVIPGKHFKEELANEGLDILDAYNVLTKGNIFKEAELDIKTGDWKYRMEGTDLEGKPFSNRFLLQGRFNGVPDHSLQHPGIVLGLANPLPKGKLVMSSFEKTRCSDCGSSARVERVAYRFRESGLDNVVLKGIEVIKCPECGNEEPIIPNLDGLLRVLALAIVTSKVPLTGAEVRYLRKYVGMSGEQFARILHTDKSTLSKWETGHANIGSKSDLLIRAVALNLGRGLQENAAQIIRNFENIDEESTAPPNRIEVDSETLEYEYA
jgi:YgiT-type zinc finger domain-containing protein